MKRKIMMTILFILTLLTMLLPWFGGTRGVQEIYGTCLLKNPIALTCIIITIVGIWMDYEHQDVIINIGLLGIIAMEIYEFLTWHILTVSGHFDLAFSFDFCYPEFYFAVMCMAVIFLLFQYINKKQARSLF